MKKLLRRCALFLLLLALGFVVAWFACPFPRELLARYPAGTVLLDRQGASLRVRLGPHDADCRPIYRPHREDWLVKAVVAAEDGRFWQHRGVDARAILRAVWQNTTHLRTVSGASTLSMQVIRLAQPRPRTLAAKAVETFRALQMERRLSKEEILAQYLNRAPFGQNLIGAEAASRRYLGKGPEDLSLAEAALLAGLPQSPTRLRPDRYPDRARRRQAYVLQRMVACGFISDGERQAARAQPLAVRPATYPFRAPHFCDLVEARLAEAGLVGGTVFVGGASSPAFRVDTPSGSLAHVGGTSSPARGAGGPAHSQPLPPATAVRTTLDPTWQRVAEEALSRHAAELAQGQIKGGAVVILDVADGAVRALVGSPDFFGWHSQGQVNAALAARAAGSTLKPFAYALAFDRGLVTPQTILADVPRTFGDYRPDNFDKNFHGLISTRDALILSLNLPALEIEYRTGQPVFYRALRQLGLDTLRQPAEHYGAGLVLGNGEVRLLDLANAYACLARGGDYRPWRVLADTPAAPGRRVFSPEACWLIAEALGGDERALDATGHAADVRLPPLAWKTGTSSGFRDAWTIAFNPEVVIGVWVGNPDGAASDLLVGKKVAAPIVWEIFRRLYPDNDGPWFARPAGLASRAVCTVSGCPPGPHCPAVIMDWYLRGSSSFRSCAVHPRPAGPDGQLAEVWPAEVAAFLARQRAAPVRLPDHPAARLARLRITSPAAGSTFRLLDELAERVQRLPLAASGEAAGGRVHWFENDSYLGAARPGEPLFWPLARGRHQIVCCDTAGLSDRVEIMVE